MIFVGTRWGNCSYSSDGCRSHLFDYSAVWHQSVAHADENNQKSCPETISSASGRGGPLSCQVSKGQDGHGLFWWFPQVPKTAAVVCSHYFSFRHSWWRKLWRWIKSQKQQWFFRCLASLASHGQSITDIAINM